MAQMFKYAAPTIYFSDNEYVPCLETGRRVYRLPEEMSDAEVLQEMYKRNGADEQNPRPILKLFLYRVVSVSTIIREQVRGEGPDGIKLTLFTLGGDSITEAQILSRFLGKIGTAKPQLVGFASTMFDLQVAFQRALINGCIIPEFCSRPAKPWEGADYFSDFSDHNIDLLSVIGGKGGKANPKLDEIALACGIPGKLGVDGSEVADMWLAGKRQEIADYNECDTATTYLLWLKLALMSGWVTVAGYQAEVAQFRALLETRVVAGAKHFQLFLDEWQRLSPAEFTTQAKGANL